MAYYHQNHGGTINPTIYDVRNHHFGASFGANGQSFDTPFNMNAQGRGVAFNSNGQNFGVPFNFTGQNLNIPFTYNQNFGAPFNANDKSFVQPFNPYGYGGNEVFESHTRPFKFSATQLRTQAEFVSNAQMLEAMVESSQFIYNDVKVPSNVEGFALQQVQAMANFMRAPQLESPSHAAFWTTIPTNPAVYWETELRRQELAANEKRLQQEEAELALWSNSEREKFYILKLLAREQNLGPEDWLGVAFVEEEIAGEMREAAKNCWMSEESDRAYDLSSSMEEFLEAEGWSETSDSIWAPEGGLLAYMPSMYKINFEQLAICKANLEPKEGNGRDFIIESMMKAKMRGQ